MEEAQQSAELCGIPGEDGETVTKEEFNRFVRVVNYYHGRPIKHDVKELKALVEQTNEMMMEHIKTDALWFAKLSGARWALYLIAAILAPVIPLLYYLIKALTTSGVL